MTNKPNIYKKAISHTAIYGASDIIRRFVGFFMLPIYTRYLTPEDYGVVQLLSVAVTFIEVFLGMRMGQAIYRYYYLENDVIQKKTVISTAFIITGLASTAAFLILEFNAVTASNVFLGDLKYLSLMKVYAVILLVQVIEEYGLIYIRIHQRPFLFFAVSVFKLLLQLSLNIYLIVFLKMGVAGVIYTGIISSGAMALFSTFYTLYYSGLHFSKDLAKSMILFSLPLWISAIAMFYIGSADKYFLRIFSNLEAVGLYALSVKISMLILVVVWAPFSNIWQTMRYEIYEMSDALIAYKRMFIMLMLALSLAGLGISLFSDVAIQIMADKAFWPASKAVPILVIGSIATALSYFNNFGIFLRKKTSIIAVGTYINAIVITVALIVFIKAYGFIGAAIGVVIGSIFNLMWIESKSRKLFDMQLPWGRAILMSATWLLCYSISYFLPSSLLIAVIGKSIIFALFIALIFILPILDADEKGKIYFYMKLFLNKIALAATVKNK